MHIYDGSQLTFNYSANQKPGTSEFFRNTQEENNRKIISTEEYTSAEEARTLDQLAALFDRPSLELDRFGFITGLKDLKITPAIKSYFDLIPEHISHAKNHYIKLELPTYIITGTLYGASDGKFQGVIMPKLITDASKQMRTTPNFKLFPEFYFGIKEKIKTEFHEDDQLNNGSTERPVERAYEGKCLHPYKNGIFCGIFRANNELDVSKIGDVLKTPKSGSNCLHIYYRMPLNQP